MNKWWSQIVFTFFIIFRETEEKQNKIIAPKLTTRCPRLLLASVTVPSIEKKYE